MQHHNIASFAPAQAFVERALEQHRQQQAKATNRRPLLLGIQGLQGSGKTSLASTLCQHFETQGLRCSAMSMDDFYLGPAQREKLAKTVHPLLRQRGVPGTHNTEQAIAVLQALRSGQDSSAPRFSKADDSPLAEEAWQQIKGKTLDLVILEGWCLGLRPQNQAQLHRPCNAMEAEQDADEHWRHYVNQRLATDYQDWFALVDQLIVLQAPSFDCVSAWRWQQEQDTAATKPNAPGIMNRRQLDAFIAKFQRLSEHALATMPARADCLIQLNKHREVSSVKYTKA